MKKSNVKPKKRRRDRAKYPALEKRFMPRVRQEYLDFDYLDKLNLEEKAWMNKFVDEYLNASFKKDGTDIQDYETYGKDSNDRNNSRNRDLYGHLKNKANKFNNQRLINYDKVVGDIEINLNQQLNPNYIEDTYLDYMEYKAVEEFLKEYAEVMTNFNEGDE